MASDNQSRGNIHLAREIAHAYIWDAIKSPRSWLATPDGPTLFDLHIHGVELDGEDIISAGERTFTGPLRMRTDAEKDLAALNHLYAPINFRARLDCEDKRAIIAVRVIEIGGSTHYFIIETAEGN
jgi:hypothetical protein